jgi:inorganic triphosphatase YgiF
LQTSKRLLGAFLFDLNTFMQVSSDKDFPQLRRHINQWRTRFPMFADDVLKIERMVEQHIVGFSNAGVRYRQTHSRSHLEQAQRELDEINRIVATVEKLELMSLLSRG